MLIEAQESVVSGVEPHLWANISHNDSRQGQVGVLIPYLHQERVNSIALTLGIQLSHYYAVVYGFAH